MKLKFFLEILKTAKNPKTVPLKKRPSLGAHVSTALTSKN